jgi:hypothetical protein
MTDETQSHCGVRIDDRGWGRYVDIPLACPRNRERYNVEGRNVVIGALTVLGGAMLFTERRRLVDLAAKNRLPAVYSWREFVDVGGLSPMDRTLLIRFGAPRPTWTGFSRVRSPAICPSSNRRSSSWSLT